MNRHYSLRARVAAATALGATIIVVALGFLVAQAIARNNVRQIDEKIATAAGLVVLSPDIAVEVFTRLGDSSQFALTVRTDGALDGSTTTQLPDLPDGSHTVKVDGVAYRVFTTSAAMLSGQSVSLGLPAAEATAATSRQQQRVIAAGALAIAAAGGLGWIFGGRAVRPIVELTDRISAPTPQELPKVSGVREAQELADAVRAMLQRVTDAQAETTAALDTARDFAAASAHELRTPLTAMRTDIEVLRTLDLDAAQQAEILDDLQRTQGRVEATLAALERLASGELVSARDHTETDIVEQSDLAGHDAMRHFPDLQVRVDSEPSLMVHGLPAGLRLALDNALSNAARHGGAQSAVISLQRHPGGTITITVDDDGSGVPAHERTAVFERFYRGSSASKGGSGLGLALVAQQAQLHGGRAYFEDSPLGGARLVIELAEAPALRVATD